ncbi:MAG: CoB--CoM heterodisulfide reductase iron-sulfur subunit A family protein [Bacteroidales bacterium]|nr:CoB--CoM heterodisulfide reductase iron-sulfur subunit A family protein [Bacteroidales bacterium]
MKEKVLIIGGGIAGMEAARQLQALGCSPLLVEKEHGLGGHVARWHKLFPDMLSAESLVTELEAGLSGVTVYRHTEVKSINRLKDSYSVKLSNGENLVVRAVLLATGFRLFEAAKKEEYGYGVYDHVVTNADLEAWMNGFPDERMPEAPRAVGFVHCVGSRDIKAGNSQCSKVCCMTAVKQAIEMRERYPQAEVYCFYMDLRLFGKKYEDFYIGAQRDFGIHFIRGRVSEVGETIDGRVQVKAEDTLLGKPVKVILDLLVLMSGMVCNPSASALAPQLRLEIDSDGFLRSRDNVAGILESGRPGIFYAGACTGTKTVPETLAEARAAALRIYQYLQA